MRHFSVFLLCSSLLLLGSLSGCQKNAPPHPIAPASTSSAPTVSDALIPTRQDVGFSKEFQSTTEPFLKTLGVRHIEEQSMPDHTVVYHFKDAKSQDVCDVSLLKNQSYPAELPLLLANAKEPKARFSFSEDKSNHWVVSVKTRVEKYSHDDIGEIFAQFSDAIATNCAHAVLTRQSWNPNEHASWDFSEFFSLRFGPHLNQLGVDKIVPEFSTQANQTTTTYQALDAKGQILSRVMMSSLKGYGTLEDIKADFVMKKTNKGWTINGELTPNAPVSNLILYNYLQDLVQQISAPQNHFDGISLPPPSSTPPEFTPPAGAWMDPKTP